MSNRSRPEAPPDLALAWNNHMARLLKHADALVREWETAARRSRETLGQTMKAAVAESSPALTEEVRRAMAAGVESLRQELLRVQREMGAHAGRGASAGRGWIVPVVAGANLLLAVGVVLLVVTRGATSSAPPPRPAVEPPTAAAAIRDAGAGAGAQAVSPAPPPPPTVSPRPAPACEALLKGAGRADARLVAAECARLTCTGAAVDRCELVLDVLSKPKLKCKPKGDAARGYAVDEPWLRECLKAK